MTEDTRDFDITIVSIVLDTKCAKNGGGTYPGCELIYKTAEGAVQTKNMHNNTFKFNKPLRVQLEALASGDYAHVTCIKEGEFVNWKTVTAIEAPRAVEQPTATPQSTQDKVASPAPTQAAVRSNYETPEERSIKQRYIVRQSCLGYAINFFALDKDFLPQSENVVELAKEFEAYVFGSTAKRAVLVAPATTATQQVLDDKDADFVVAMPD